MVTQKRNFLTLVTVALLSSVVTLVLTLGVGDINARPQQYTGTEDHVVSLDKAVRYVENFKSAPLAPMIKGGYFGRSIFDKILAQPGCVGIRYYYAKKDDGTATLVLVGVDRGGNDMTYGPLGEESFPCPPFCPGPSELNK